MTKKIITLGILLGIVLVLAAIPMSGLAQTTNETDATLELAGSNTPVIIDVNTDNTSYDPNQSATTTVTIWFTVEDADGYLNLDNSTAEVHINGSSAAYGPESRSNTSCTAVNIDWQTNNYTCTIDMQYYDVHGVWNINVSISDDDTNYVENTTETFTYNTLTAMAVNKTSLDFGTLNVGQQDVPADGPIGIENYGNQNLTDINVTAIDLQGVTYTDYSIPAGNFEADGDGVANAGTTLANDTTTKIGTLYIDKGLGENQPVYFHVDIPSTNIQIQPYNTTGLGAWTIAVND